jgi:hypothetical protein
MFKANAWFSYHTVYKIGLHLGFLKEQYWDSKMTNIFENFATV